jgi:hypothetical protein
VRVQIASELHAEIDPRRAMGGSVDLGADLVVLAGDIDRDGSGVRWAAEMWPATPVVYGVGNHEAYGRSMDAALEQTREAAVGTSVHVLEREAVTLAGLPVLGATLWSDLALAGGWAFARWRLGQSSTDDHAIVGEDGRSLRPEQTRAIHHDTVAWLDGALDEAHDGPTLMVTHHAPSPRSLGRRLGYRDVSIGATDAAYASELEWLIERHAPAAWIHGHTHRSGEYRVGATRETDRRPRPRP